MNDPTLSPAKLLIAAICIIGFINATQMLNLVLSPVSKQIGSIYPLYFSASIIFSIICLVGLWLSKRWAAYAYATILSCNQLALLNMGLWGISSAIIPIIIIGLLATAFRRI